MKRVALIDNYDSFTWNLFHYVSELGADVTVTRNDAVTADDVLATKPDAIILSPGPCTPNQAGICLELIDKAAARVPIFGVCLGLQAMGQAFGGAVTRAPVPMHGKVSTIHHRGQGVFFGINGPFKATRYHSLIVDRIDFPDCLAVTAESEDGLVMGLSHRDFPLHGVQFHPESIVSEHGMTVLKNFLDLAARWNSRRIDA